MAQKPHEPTDKNRKLVLTLTGYGVTEVAVGRELGISVPTLTKYYRNELDCGVDKANAQVAQSLFLKATGDGSQSVSAAIFWLKTRAGWRETTEHIITEQPFVRLPVVAGCIEEWNPSQPVTH